MRISALLPVLLIAAPARADHTSSEHVATLVPPRAERATGPIGDARGITGARAARPDPFLSAREVAAEVRPYAPDIERCYLEHLDDVHHAGHLDLTFVIGRDGYIVSLTAAAPSLPARSARKVEACIRDAASVLHFPARKNDTTAVVPYYFQHTNAPGGGPQQSCWNPKGCH